MSIFINERYGEVPFSPDEAYLPFPSVRDELIDNDQVPFYSVNSAIDTIRKGFMPDKGAVVKLGSGICGAFDLVAVERVTHREAIILPARKDVVHRRTDRIAGQSVLIFTDDEGDIKVLGTVDKRNGFNHQDRNCRAIGDYVLREHGIDAPKYKIVKDDSGVLVCRSPISMPRTFLLG